ncbi:UNVERIFIED_CONTAM: hypothetical protein GTU68_017687 [Idotea baltica]|nr:hypothetical protein [Idotea baltica]
MFKEDSLKGKTILVTGGGSGLGKEMSRSFLELGANVAICGRSQDRLDAAVKELSSAGPVWAQSCDVRDEKSVTELIEGTVKHFGSLHGLVNNAAGNFYSASEDLSSNGFQTVVDIVLLGTFHCTQAAGKYWIENKLPGNVINITTTYTQTGSAFVLPSACAKAGVYALTTTLAYEWATYNIRLNAISPGPIPTEGAWKRLMPGADFEELYKKRLPMGRFGTPDELGNLASFLMSDLSSYINGSCITMDGGEHLQGGEFNFLTQMMDRKSLKGLFSQMKSKQKKG